MPIMHSNGEETTTTNLRTLQRQRVHQGRLFKCAVEGDEEAREHLLGEMQEFLEAFIGRHVYCRADRDDLVQESLVVLLGKLDEGDVRVPSVEAWAAKVAWQLIKRHRSGEYRCGKRRQLMTHPYASIEVGMSSIGAEDAEEAENFIDQDRFIG